MRVALGLKAHSGWAALVCIGSSREGLQVVDRRRIELIEAGEVWAKMPYHSAEELKGAQAQSLVKRGVESAHRVAAREMRDTVDRLRERGDDIVACAVLTPDPMPKWSTEDILSVHFRMHKAEGVLFPDALCRAAEACEVRLLSVPEKQLDALAAERLGASADKIAKAVATLGKSAGPPWGKDQKTATVAAMIALRAGAAVRA
jgi:hypothetical protein